MSDATQLLSKAAKFLTDNRLAVLSTVHESCAPQSAFIYYVVDKDYSICFATPRESRKIKNILKNNRVALVVAQEIEPYELQVEGVAEIITDFKTKSTIWNKYSYVANKNPASLNFPPLMQLETNEGLEVMKIKIQWFRYSEFSGHEPYITEGALEDLKKLD
ncbi:MAG: pyridoxamine 5'-phosphate oxidase family protein [bacterium]|nr:pyridoxamine 5'-phosphate oxidase family protein [bacterium]